MLIDLTFFMTLFTVVTGIVYLADSVWFSRRRVPAKKIGALVEVSRSMFPVIFAVLLVRSFLFEPFRIPSDSMMPTLVAGDYIFVNKFIYGLRLPVVNRLILSVDEPQRGDVVVFHEPKTPSVLLIKRLVGLPGDLIEVRGDAIWVNGIEIRVHDTGIFTADGCYENFHEGTEQLGAHSHGILFCPIRPQYVKDCTGARIRLVCGGSPEPAAPAEDRSVAPTGRWLVPEGQYFFMGDNRDNSGDSRFEADLGFVPREYLVGKAVRIGFSYGTYRGSAWARMGSPIA